MLRKLVFVGMILVLMASFTVVLADQDGRDNWCNSDQYGCWVTGDDGEQWYIMFWSESARDYFMGPGSNAVVTDPFPAGKMPLAPARLTSTPREDAIADIRAHFMETAKERIAEIGEEAYFKGFDEYVASLSDSELEEWLAYLKGSTVEANDSEEEEEKYCTKDGDCLTEEELNQLLDNMKADIEAEGKTVESCFWDEESQTPACVSYID